MEILQTRHESIRILASRELKETFGIDFKLERLKSKKANPKNKCLGVALENLKMVDASLGTTTIEIPKVFNTLISLIQTNLKEEGIFRKEGSKPNEKAIMEVLNRDEQLNSEISIDEITSVFKTLLRNIPGYLIPEDISCFFYAAGKLESGKMEEALHLCVLLLPLRNLHLLIYLMKFFNEITQQSGSNKMNSYNLAVVIAPNIFPAFKEKDMQVQAKMSKLTLTITKTLIEQYKILQTVPVTLINKLEDLNEEQLTIKPRICKCFN